MKVGLKDVRKFLGRKNYSPSNKYDVYLSKFVRECGELEEDAVRSYLDETYPNPNSRNTVMQAIKTFARSVKRRIPPTDPGADLKRHELGLVEDIDRARTTVRIGKRALTVGELGDLLDTVRKSSYWKRELTFSTIWLFHWFGFRPGEFVSLKPSMIDYAKNEMIVETEKTKVQRKLFFTDFTEEQLRKYLGKQYGYQWVYKQFKRLEPTVPIEKFTPKSGRRFAETEFQRAILASGLDLVRADLITDFILGHTVSGDIAKSYVDVEDDIRRVMTDIHPMLLLEEKFH